MTYDFRGKTAVVTGASRGLGEAIARTLAEDGARVALVARSGDKLRDLAASLPNDPLVIEADLSRSDGWRSAADAVLAALPKIDILVNNAGVGGRQQLHQMTAEDLDQVLMVNVRNLIMLSHALTKSLTESRGCIVNISSVSAFSGGVGQIAYSTSKGAVNAFTRNASIDLGRAGVRVNAIAPGVIDDGMWKTAFESGVDREKTFEAMRRLLPLEGRWGTAQNIADAVAWLASDKAAYVTGQTIRVDGGMII
jgi:NAD(P)-dependent dehydrogenase (short-subunit alcohol dehydrogenase family)